MSDLLRPNRDTRFWFLTDLKRDLREGLERDPVVHFPWFFWLMVFVLLMSL